VAKRSLKLDIATLREILDERWPDAVGEHRARTDESHRLVLLHPEYDGFVTLTATARADFDGVFVVPDEQLVDIVTSHHRTGPLARGQELPIDLELHPGKVREPASSGLLQLVDASGEAVAPAVRLTLATDTSVSCVLAGVEDGPFADAESFEQAVDDLRAGRGNARRLAQRVEAMHDDKSDPGWSRMPWRRG
jgi:hypothetical protein